MAIVRGTRASDQYTLIRTDIFDDPQISYRAKGILAYLLASPEVDRQNLDSAALADVGPDSAESVHEAIQELVFAGYVTCSQGSGEPVWEVHDAPQEGKLFPESFPG